MKKPKTLIFVMLLSLIALVLGITVWAMDPKEWEADIASETALLKEQLPLAQKGNEEAIRKIIGLSTGEYSRTAEGDEWLGEIYLDLLVAHPEKFLRLLSESEETPMKIVVLALLRPVNDKYPNSELKAAVEKAKKNGVNAPFLQELLDSYSKD